MTKATDIDMRKLKRAIADNTHQIAELTIEMRVGFATIDAKFANVYTKFANVDTKFANIDTQLADIRSEIIEVRGDIQSLDRKFEERTKVFAQRLDNKEFIIRSTTVTISIGLLLTFTKFLFFGLTH